jgi:protein ImuA
MPLSNVMPIKRKPNRARIVDDLRRVLPKLEALPAKVLPFGVSTLDDWFPQGGLAFGALHEVAPEAAHDMPAAFGFVTALLARMQSGPVLLVTSPRGLGSCGCPHGHGLNALGLDPARMILVEAGDERQALWAMEEALRSGAPAAVAGAIGKGLDLKASQRLQLAARTSGLPLLLLRPGGALGGAFGGALGGALGLSAAMTRWRIGAVEAARDSFGLIARWRWRVQLERCRNGRPGKWVVEWDHVAHRFSLAATMADPALPHSAGTHPLARAG